MWGFTKKLHVSKYHLATVAAMSGLFYSQMASAGHHSDNSSNQSHPAPARPAVQAPAVHPAVQAAPMQVARPAAQAVPMQAARPANYAQPQAAPSRFQGRAGQPGQPQATRYGAPVSPGANAPSGRRYGNASPGQAGGDARRYGNASPGQVGNNARYYGQSGRDAAAPHRVGDVMVHETGGVRHYGAAGHDAERAAPGARGGVPVHLPQRVHGGRTYSYQGRHMAAFRVGPYRHHMAYHHYRAGAFLPRDYIDPFYYIEDWDYFGVPAPDEGTQWVRYGPDLLLVNTDTGSVINGIYGVFDETGSPGDDVNQGQVVSEAPDQSDQTEDGGQF